MCILFLSPLSLSLSDFHSLLQKVVTLTAHPLFSLISHIHHMVQYKRVPNMVFVFNTSGPNLIKIFIYYFSFCWKLESRPNQILGKLLEDNSVHLS